MQPPTGINCVDIEVHTVTAARNANTPRQIIVTGQKCGKIPLGPESIFPIVEGVFGPLRIPVPRTPVLLFNEYGADWATVRRMNVIAFKCRSRVDLVRGAVKRCSWPTVAIVGCPQLVGGYWGAGTEPTKDDLPWRFL